MKKLLLALAVCLVAGCANVTTAPDPLKDPPKAGESVVAVTVTDNTSRAGAFTSMTVQRMLPGETSPASHIMRLVAPGLSRDTALFIAVLPEGEYEFASFSTGTQILNLNPGSRRLIGKFTVAGGKAVDLGRLVVTPLNTSVLVGRSARVTSNLPLMRRFAPEQAQLYGGEVRPGWNGPRTAEDRIEEYALGRPVGADNPVEAADGRIVAGSRLGSVLVRSPQGRWDTLRSEGLESILYAAPVDLPDARIVAAGEFNTLLRQPPGVPRLVAIDTGDLPPGNLLYVGGSDALGWYVAHQRGTEISIFRSARLDAGQWQAIRKESAEASIWSGPNRFWIWSTPRGLGYALSEGAIRFLDFGTGAWTERKAPNNHRLNGIAPNPDGTLGILTSPGGGFGGIFAGLYLSKDEGATWQEVPTEFKVKMVPPQRSRSGTMFLAGGVFSNPELHASRDEGKTWQKVSDFKLDRRLVILPSGAMLAVDSGSFGLFSIQRSSNEGASWQTEYSNFDRAAYDARQKK